LAARIDPSTLLITAIFASVLMSINFGSAVAARIPRITMTTINSIKVKPVCFFICSSQEKP